MMPLKTPTDPDILLAVVRAARPIYDRLLDYYSEEEALLWLFLPHPLLAEKVPLQLVIDKQGDRVMQLLAGLDSGVFV